MENDFEYQMDNARENDDRQQIEHYYGDAAIEAEAVEAEYRDYELSQLAADLAELHRIRKDAFVQAYEKTARELFHDYKLDIFSDHDALAVAYRLKKDLLSFLLKRFYSETNSDEG